MTPAESTTPRAGRSGLTRRRILEVALRALDEQGIEALSMRRLAAELGVGTMTLYGYFPDKEALLDAVVDAVAEAQPLPAVDGAWDVRLRALLHHFHDGLLAHPGIVALRLARPIATPAAFRLTEACMAALRDAGLDRAQAAAAFRTLFVFTFGAAAFAVRGGQAQRAQVGAVLAGLPPDEFPELHGAIPEALALMEPGRSFEAGIDLLLAGITAR